MKTILRSICIWDIECHFDNALKLYYTLYIVLHMYVAFFYSHLVSTINPSPVHVATGLVLFPTMTLAELSFKVMMGYKNLRNRIEDKKRLHVSYNNITCPMFFSGET